MGIKTDLMSSIDLTFNYYGTYESFQEFQKHNEVKLGSVIHISPEKQTYVYCTTGWEPIEDIAVASLDDENEVRPIKREKCVHCGAPLKLHNVDKKGICTCDFCRSDNYVW